VHYRSDACARASKRAERRARAVRPPTLLVGAGVLAAAGASSAPPPPANPFREKDE
jgi:hypothetical protein